MSAFEKLHAWIRRNTTVCGMTLEEIDESKVQWKKEQRYKELLKERDELAKILYCLRVEVRRSDALPTDSYITAYEHANEFMLMRYNGEWVDALDWKKGGQE